MTAAVKPGPGDIGVVVVSHASAGTIEACLRRLLASAGIARVIVVDNASPDDSAARVARLAVDEPRLTLVRNSENRGFGAACNQGATALAQPWLAFVNPDAYVGADTLARLLAHAQARPGAGLLGVELVDEQGRPDPASRRMDPTLAELLRGARHGSQSLSLGRDPAQSLQSVDAVSGALMLMPTGLFVRLSGFDEGYRLHAEDLDLCRRVRLAGYEVLVANDVRVLHLRGVSSRSRPLWVEWHKHRGIWRYLRRYDPACRRPWGAALAATLLGLRLLWAAPRAWWRARTGDRRPPSQR